MKQNLMNEVIQGMLPFLNNAQMESRKVERESCDCLYNFADIFSNIN